MNVVGILFALLLLVFPVVGAWMWFQCLVRPLLWRGATGIVANAAPVVPAPGQDISISEKSVGYTYVVDGKTFDGAFQAWSWCEAGEEIAVFYKPSDPTRHGMPSSTQFIIGAVVLLIGLLTTPAFVANIWQLIAASLAF